jgi:4-amino-4-deoxy-L-arabinose transferase-like glycosyltransferase
MEEPRRAMVAMEMWFNQDLIVPRQLGEHYYKKPPFFNWILLLMVRLWGDYSEWILRVPTVLSTLAMGGLSYWMGRRYVNAEFGWLAGLLFVLSVDVLFSFSMLAEIDLFYSLVTYAAMLSIFHFYQTERFYRLFPVLYLLTAIGVLTKGAPSVVFTGLSLVVFLISQRRWRLLFSLPHIVGGLVFLSIVGGYLWIYSQRADLWPFLQTQLGESSERTVAEQGFWALVKHLFVYPLDTVKNLLPASLFLLFLARRDAWRLIRSNPFIFFSALMFVANFLPYWLAPGARQRYIYMLFPFAIHVLIYAYQHRTDLTAWRTKAFRTICGVLLSILFLASLALPFIPDFQFLTYRSALAPIFGLILGVLLYGFYRRRDLALYWLMLALIAGRLIFDLTVLPQRAHHSGAQADRALAGQIHRIVGEEDVYLYCFQRMSFTTVIYLNKLRGRPLERLQEKNTQDFFIYERIAYDDPVEVYLTFEYDGREFVLGKFR